MSIDFSLETEYPQVTEEEVEHLFDEEGNIIVGERRQWLLGRRQGRAEGRAEGRVEGKAEGKAEGQAEGLRDGVMLSLQKLMQTMDWGIDEAMDALDIPQAERQIYIDRLTH